MLIFTPRSMISKFMLAPIIGAALIAILAVILIRMTSNDLDQLDNLNDQEAASGYLLSEIGHDLAFNHALIYNLLASIDDMTGEGEFYDKSKPLLFKIHEIHERIEVELLPTSRGDEEMRAVTELAGSLEQYRINATNAMLTATVDADETRRVMNEASKHFNDLNTSLLDVNRLINRRLNAQLAEHQASMQDRVVIFAVLFLVTAVAMLAIGLWLSRILSSDLRALAAQLENILSEGEPDVQQADRSQLVVDTLRYAIERVSKSHDSLERFQNDLARTNEELRVSLETLAERETALEQLNAELAATVSRQEDLIQRQQRAEEARDAALSAAEHANAAKNDFLSNMSHELRTPLNAIIGFSEMIEAAAFGPIGSKYQEYASDIHVSGTHLLNLVTDILDISRIEAGKLEIHWDYVYLDQILAACETMLRKRAADAGIRFDVQLADDLPQLHTDAFRIRQILINLIENAIKFSREGESVTIAAELHANGDLVITVTDTGIGIAREDIPMVLEKFGQVRTGHQHSHGGVGIGLAIASLLVELLDGDLTITSDVGEGTTVTLAFPERRTYLPPDRGRSVC